MFKRPLESLLEKLAQRREGLDAPAQQGWQGPQFQPPPVPQESGADSALGRLASLGASRLLARISPGSQVPSGISMAAGSAKSQGLGGWGDNVKTETFGLSPFPARTPETPDAAPPIKRKHFLDYVKREF